MNNALTAEVELARHQRCSWWTVASLSAVTIVGLIFVAVVALPYFNLATLQASRYWPRRWWLLVHIASGIVALLTGPVQLWLGLSERRVGVHRRLGIIYIASVTVSSLTAYVLAFKTTLGFAFGAGLTGLATAWVLTTGLAVTAIRRHLFEQHKEWMIRSYVVTTAFVTFRVVFEVFKQAGVGTVPERLAATAWLCWSIPLLLAEVVLQGRKMTSTSEIQPRQQRRVPSI
jgi:hypothetical protein